MLLESGCFGANFQYTSNAHFHSRVSDVNFSDGNSALAINPKEHILNLYNTCK